METEAVLLWGLLLLILLVLLVVLVLLIHAGVLEPVNVKTCKPSVGSLKIAYKFARGPYKQSGILFTQAHTLLPCYRTIGVYYDDPNTNEANRLRYIVGLIISENEEPVNCEHMKLLSDNGYKYASFPSIDHAVEATFPFKSTISIIVAIMKVYPALRHYIEERTLCARPFIEIYNSSTRQILFIGPLVQQDEFYVPEVLEELLEIENDMNEDMSSNSWEESVSFINGAEGDNISEDTVDDSPLQESCTEIKEAEKIAHADAACVVQKAPTQQDDDSDNTGSSFEEIETACGTSDAPAAKVKEPDEGPTPVEVKEEAIVAEKEE